MRKLTFSLIFALPAALLVWACYLIFFAPAEPPIDWERHMSVVDHDARVALLDHIFLVASYVITWAIQLGYLAWLGVKWRAQSRPASSSAR
jgi:hypothetical protein